jgi:uncharacterized protein YhaN
MAENIIIHALRLENFGCYREKKFTFTEGCNQLVGPNESGKSTVIRALMTAFYEDGSTTKKAVGKLRNWHTNIHHRIVVDFSVGAKRFTLIRDYGTGKDTMTDSDGVVYEGKAINEKLARYFGTPDRVLFESIFSFTSDNPAAPDSTRNRLKAAIETPVLSGFDRSGADSRLAEEIKQIDNPRAHGPRELDVVADNISTLLQEKLDLEKRLEELEKDKAELDEVREKLQEYEERVDYLDKEMEGATAYHELSMRMNGLEERLQVHLSNYSRVAQISEDLERIEKERSVIHAPTTEKLAELATERDKLNTGVDEAKRHMDSLIGRRKKANRGFLAATLILVILCLAFVVDQHGYIPYAPVTDVLPYTIPIMAVIWLVRVGTYIFHFMKKKVVTRAFRNSVGAVDKFYADLNTEYDLQAADPIKGLVELLQRRQALELSAENLRQAIDALSEGKGLEYLNEIRTRLEQEVAQVNGELGPLAAFAASSGKLPEIKEELISKRVRANAMRERAGLLSERCSILDAMKDSLNQIEQQVESRKRQHIELTERLEILKIARMALNRAADQLIEDTFTSYSDDASKYVSRLTNGRYDAVRFSRDANRFEVRVGESDRWIELNDSLSSSTRDCVYLAFRLAAAGRVAADFTPPLIFDQTEVRMDDRRRQIFYDIVGEIALQQQVIYVALQAFGGGERSSVLEFSETDFEPAGVTV